MQRTILVALVAWAVAVPQGVLAQEGSDEERIERPDPYATGSQVNGLTAFGILGFGLWDLGLGAGIRYAFPVSEGVIQGSADVRDEFALEVGADLVYYMEDDALVADETLNTLQVLPVAGLLWNFWLADDTIGLYPKLELGYEIYIDDDPLWDEGFYWDLVGGIIWNLESGLTLRGEVSRNLLRIGVALGF